MRKTLRVFQIGELYLCKGKEELDVNGRMVRKKFSGRSKWWVGATKSRPAVAAGKIFPVGHSAEETRSGTVLRKWWGFHTIFDSSCDFGAVLAQSSLVFAICGAQNTSTLLAQSSIVAAIFVAAKGAKMMGFLHNPRLYLRFVVPLVINVGFICEI